MTKDEAAEYLKSLGPEKGLEEFNSIAQYFFDENMKALKNVQDKLNALPEKDKLMLSLGVESGNVALLGSYGDDGFMAFGNTEGLKSRLRNILKGMMHEKGVKASELYDMIDGLLDIKTDYQEKHL